MPSRPVVDAAYIAAAQKTVRTLRHSICSEHSLSIAQVVKAALHDVCTYDASTKSGGANGTVRTPKELERPENNGLEPVIRALQKIAAENAPLTFADTLQIALAVAIMAAGGPDIAVRVGRRDSKVAVPSGRLPSIDCEKEPIDVAPVEKAFKRSGLSNKHALLVYSIIGLGQTSVGVLSLSESSCLLSPICIQAALEEISGQRKVELPVCKGMEDSVKIVKALVASDPALVPFANQLCSNDAFFSDQVAQMLETASQIGSLQKAQEFIASQKGQAVILVGAMAVSAMATYYWRRKRLRKLLL